MKSIRMLYKIFFVALLTALICSCANNVRAEHQVHHPDKEKTCTVQDRAGMTYTKYGEHACEESIHSCQLWHRNHPNTGTGCMVI